MASTDDSIKTVAIVDDDEHGADVMGEILRDAGYSPSILAARGDDVHEFAEDIKRRCDGAVCDHRLKYSGYQFYGADLVAVLTTNHVPAILVTQFLPMDFDVSIRRWRHLIPVLLKRDDADDSSRIRSSLEYCVRELQGEPASTRRPHRSLVRVVELLREAGQDVIDAYVPSWNAREAVRFPRALLGELEHQVEVGSRFYAQVNVGALNSEDLFLYDFEPAGEPRSDDSIS